jgi:2-polyprenyl-3-methyl-5-hydroxy-6-metoxy-1,4-benzoquinol methylase
VAGESLPLKRLLLPALARLGLLGPTYRAHEWLRSLAARSEDVVPPDGLPLPPAQLRIRVAGTADAAWFLESGRLAEQAIRAALERAGVRLDELPAILDFGCGCGRVVRRLAELPGDVHGSDFDAGAIAWCRENLPFASFRRNDLAPPLRSAAKSFDLVYALSVLTHLPVDLQHAWVQELTRVLRPGGMLLVTTHGERYLDRLNAAERDAFARGEVVVRFEQVAGTNLCTAFHPPAYVQETLARGLEVLDFVPEGAEGNPHQDLFLLRKP